MPGRTHFAYLMDITSFDDLLQAANLQTQPQRLLFVFTSAELPADATPAQRARFEAGEGGELAPLMCVDKTPAELPSFATLQAEARQAGPAWDIVFVAAMTDRPGGADEALQRMVEAVKQGSIDGFLAFDAAGEIVHFRS